MQLSSSAFANGASIPEKYTCQGENINPPLSWSEEPNGARSLALIIDDPDAPGGTWVHWILFNIDPKTKEMAANSVPAGASQGMNSANEQRYGGPCPPPGNPHRYFFKLYALDTPLQFGKNPTKPEIESAMQGHILGQSELMGTYQQK